MGNTIYASFNDPALAERAAGALLDFGVRPDDISVVQSRRRIDDGTTEYNTSSYASERPVTLSHPTAGEIAQVEAGIPMSTEPVIATTRTDDVEDADQIESSAKYGISTTTAADSEAGAAKGAAWGAGVGILAAIASLAIPGFGLIIGGGALAIALGGVAASAGAGAIAGAVTGYLRDQGVDEHVAREYEGAMNSGGALLAVTVPSAHVAEIDARMILDKYGAVNINAYASRGYLA